MAGWGAEVSEHAGKQEHFMYFDNDFMPVGFCQSFWRRQRFLESTRRRERSGQFSVKGAGSGDCDPPRPPGGGGNHRRLSAEKSGRERAKVEIDNSAWGDGEISAICYRPGWNQNKDDWSGNQAKIAWLDQVSLKDGKASLAFQVAGTPESGSYALLLGTRTGKFAWNFSLVQTPQGEIQNTPKLPKRVKNLVIKTSGIRSQGQPNPPKRRARGVLPMRKIK